jgi:arylsulfatase A-like enzyme
VDTLKTEDLWDNTLLFFLTDNGGSKAMNANNAPLRGFKQQNYEGGIRTPFVVSWPAQVKGGRTCDTPVISLDILPTSLAAAGLEPPQERPFDGKSLLPLLHGETKVLHEHLFWSEGGSSGEWAVRSGNWKLLASQDQRELYDLGTDPGEQTNLAKKHPDKVKQLMLLYDSWLDEMAKPNSGAPKRWGEATAEGGSPQDQVKQKKREERKKTRAMEKKKSG